MVSIKNDGYNNFRRPGTLIEKNTNFRAMRKYIMMKNLKSKFKLFFLLGIMFAFVTYTGCVNDEENPDNVASKLIGLWTISDAQIDATIGGLSITDFLIDMGLSEVEAAAFTLLFNQALLANFSGTIEFKA
ncbi:MAG: hypothetical protein ACXAC2_24450, partial [Candidatus Kariarchaeaceae archaeon]